MLSKRMSSRLAAWASLTVWCALSAVAEESAPARYIPPANHFTVATPGSAWLNLSRPLAAEDLRDRVVLLDFWTYCCVNCLQTIPELAKLEKEFGADLVVIGVHSAKFDTEKETDLIRQAVLRYGVEHPVVNDRDFRIWRAFEVRAWPTLVLLRPDGEVALRVSGEGHTEELRKAIRETLRKSPKRAKTKLPLELERTKVERGEFFFPSKLSYDESTKTLFVSDSSHHQIAAYTWDPKQPAKLRPAFRIGKKGESGSADGTYAAARFRRPQGVLARKGVLYVADTENHLIRKVDLNAKRVSTIAGTGKPGPAISGKSVPSRTPLASPWDLAFHPDENSLVIAMAGVHQLWSLDLKRGRLEAVAGTGVEAIDDGIFSEKNTLSQPSAVSSLLGSLYFLDAESSALRFYFETYVRTLVGTGLFDFGFKDGDRKKAKLQHPLGLFADVTGVFIADTFNHAIRRYDPAKQTLETVVGDGKAGEGGANGPEDATQARLREPSGITKLTDGIFVISDTDNHRLVLWNRESGKVERMRIEGETTGAKAAPAEPLELFGRKRFNARLPNRIPIADATVSRPNAEIRITLPEKYHLNAEGPSFARLFVGAPPREAVKQEWKREDLLKSLVLPVTDLRSGAEYFFQGTFYYCLDGKNAVCEIASVSFPIRLDASGAERIDVPIRSAPSGP